MSAAVSSASAAPIAARWKGALCEKAFQAYSRPNSRPARASARGGVAAATAAESAPRAPVEGEAAPLPFLFGGAGHVLSRAVLAGLLAPGAIELCLGFAAFEWREWHSDWLLPHCVVATLGLAPRLAAWNEVMHQDRAGQRGCDAGAPVHPARANRTARAAAASASADSHQTDRSRDSLRDAARVIPDLPAAGLLGRGRGVGGSRNPSSI